MNTAIAAPPVAPPTNAASIDVLNSARRRALRMRAEWLTQVHEGLITVTELISYAATDDGAPLRVIRLRDLLLSQDRWGQARADAAMQSLREVLYLGNELPLRRLTVSWLLDNRTNGQRFDAFLDVLGAERIAPWRGFPFLTPHETRS